MTSCFIEVRPISMHEVSFPEPRIGISIFCLTQGNERYCSRSVLSKKWELLEVIKRCPKPCFTIPLIRKNRFNLFEYVYHWQNCVSKFYGIRKRWFCKISYRISHVILLIALLILKEILPSYSFLMSWKSKCKIDSVTESKWWNLFSRIRRTVEQRLGHIFITPSSSHFFNKVYLEQYLFMVMCARCYSFSEPLRIEAILDLSTCTQTLSSICSKITVNSK